jgi:hypothetical protein
MGSGERVSYEPQYQTGLTEFGAKCSQGCYTIRKLDRASSNRFADRPPGTSGLGQQRTLATYRCHVCFQG